MTAEEVNEKLLEVQKQWLEEIILPYAIEHPDSHLSDPFCFGVSEDYLAADKKLMIIGQETSDFSPLEKDTDLFDGQEWSYGYAADQVKDYPKDPNHSPFWNLFRRFAKDGIVACWNNVDSIQRSRYIENGDHKSDPLTYDLERALQRPFGKGQKTLLKYQLELARPDVVYFATGPYYQETMELALMLPKGTLNDKRPCKGRSISDISDLTVAGCKIFWSYHPNYLSRLGKDTFEQCVRTVEEDKI